MTIAQVIGGFVIMLAACIGIATIGFFCYQGLYAVAQRHYIGLKAEEAAIRDLLEVKDLERMAK